MAGEQDIWEIPKHQMGRDKHMAGHIRNTMASNSRRWTLDILCILSKNKLIHLKCYGNLEIDGKSQNRPFLHFNAYKLLNNCHFNCGNRQLLLISNICIIYFNFAFVIHFFGMLPSKLDYSPAQLLSNPPPLLTVPGWRSPWWNLLINADGNKHEDKET